MINHKNEKPLKPSRVLVIGSRGFVGCNIIENLKKQSIEVLGISSQDIDLVNSESVDRLVGQISKDDSIVFVSALTPDKGRDVSTLMKNLRMIENFSAALSKRPCKHVVYISSDAVYSSLAGPINESSACDPDSFHGVMHITREKILKNICQQKSIPLLLLRPVALFGLGDTHNGYGPNRFFRTAIQEKTIGLFGGGEEKRDHLHIKDFAEIVSQSLLHQTEGVLTAATGQAISFMDIAQEVKRIVGSEVEIKTSARANPITHVYYDNTLLSKAFNKFSFTPFADAMRASAKMV